MQRIIDAIRNPCTMDSPTISGCSLRIGSAPETRCGHCRSLCPGFLRDPGACWKDGGQDGQARPGQVGGVTAVGPGKAKDTGCGERGAGDRDGTPSRSCPAQKRKNFVSRARTTSLRSVVLPTWGGNTSSAIPPSPWAGSRVPTIHCTPTCYDQPWRTEPRTARQWIRYLVVAVIALFLVWWMLRVYVL